MEMSIEESMKVLQEVPNVMPITKESINVALDTMRKYQKIQKIIEDWNNEQINNIICCLDIKKVVEDGTN